MYGGPVTPLVGWLGAAIGKGLRQLWEGLGEVGRIMRKEFVRVFDAERQKVIRPARKLNAPVRGGLLPDWLSGYRVDSGSNR